LTKWYELKKRNSTILGDYMKRRTVGYALFVFIVIVTLTSLPFLVGKIDSIYLLLIMTAIGFLWAILRIYMRKNLVAKKTKGRTSSIIDASVIFRDCGP